MSTPPITDAATATPSQWPSDDIYRLVDAIFDCKQPTGGASSVSDCDTAAALIEAFVAERTDAEVKRLREILSTPAQLRAHTLRQFPDYSWESAEFIGRLRAAAERVEALEIERAALPRRLATALWEWSALRHGLFTPMEFAGICERAIERELARTP